MTFHNYLKYLTILFVLALFSNCEKTASAQEQEDEEEEIFEGIEGKYPGVWNSVTPSITYVDYSISGIFRYSNGLKTKMKAEFFATPNYMSCCDLDDDGTMTFDVEDLLITNFNFDDDVLGCEGSFKGVGVVKENGDIEIQFTGNDCDGDHVGTLLFYKQ